MDLSDRQATQVFPGLAIAKSDSPPFFQQTLQQCLTQLAEGRRSPTEFETAKQHLSDIVAESVHRLRNGSVSLTVLEYGVELREEPAEKLMSKRLAQPYQAVWLLTHQGKNLTREFGGFVSHQSHESEVTCIGKLESQKGCASFRSYFGEIPL